MNLCLQYAHHTHDESEERGHSSLDDVLKAFDSFDWEGECEKAHKLERVSPTISLESSDKSKMIFVSGVGEKIEDMEFVSHCYYPGIVSKWFGLSEKMEEVTHDSQTFTHQQSREALRLFMLEDYNSLKRLYETAS